MLFDDEETEDDNVFLCGCAGCFCCRFSVAIAVGATRYVGLWRDNVTWFYKTSGAGSSGWVLTSAATMRPYFGFLVRCVAMRSDSDLCVSGFNCI